jgi:hypothetical protein
MQRSLTVLKGAPFCIALIGLAQLASAAVLLVKELGSEKISLPAYGASLSALGCEAK